MAFKFQLTEAHREKIWAKIAVLGPSGSGKSYSLLKLATGMLQEMIAKELPIGNGKIAFLNTEGPRGRYYANEFKYDIVDLVAPHNPEMYVEAIEYVEKLGYPICILDSSSAEWEGKGGCLELHQDNGGNFQAWAKITPRHDHFIKAIANSNMHMLVSMRGKDQYEVEKGDGNKTSIKKLGVGAQQRNGFEYEFTATFSLDDTFAKSQKDNTHLFEGLGAFRLNEKHGIQLIDWANSGEGFTPQPKENSLIAEKLPTITDCVNRMKELGGRSSASASAIWDSFIEYAPDGKVHKMTDAGKIAELHAALLAFVEPEVTPIESTQGE
jgi:hypothetical protein